MPVAFGSAFIGAQGAGANYQPAHRNHFEVQIGTFPTILPALSCTVPKTELEKVELYHFNERVKVAAKPNPQDIRVEIYDYVQPALLETLNSWYKNVYDSNTGEMGYASTYKMQVQIFQYDIEGNLLRTYTCSGCWLTSQPFPEEAFDYSSGEPVKITLNIACDRVTIDGNSGAGGPGSTGGLQTIA